MGLPVGPEAIERRILLIRGLRVMLDADLAAVYGVSTKRLNEQVKRNRNRFPADFMIRLTSQEKSEVVAKCDHLQRLKFSANLPAVFTEHGAVMLACVLNSPVAVNASIHVVRAFIRLREMLAAHKDLARRLDDLERKYDVQFKAVFDAIRDLMAPPREASPPNWVPTTLNGAHVVLLWLRGPCAGSSSRCLDNFGLQAYTSTVRRPFVSACVFIIVLLSPGASVYPVFAQKLGKTGVSAGSMGETATSVKTQVNNGGISAPLAIPVQSWSLNGNLNSAASVAPFKVSALVLPNSVVVPVAEVAEPKTVSAGPAADLDSLLRLREVGVNGAAQTQAIPVNLDAAPTWKLDEFFAKTPLVLEVSKGDAALELDRLFDNTDAKSSVNAFLKSGSPEKPLPPGIVDITGSEGRLNEPVLKKVLGRFVDGVSVVAMGESVHNSEGYMTARIAMTKILIEGNKARHLLLEQPGAPLEEIDRYLKGGYGDPAVLVKKLYGIWQSNSFVDFLRWIRRHNSDHPEALVSIVGIDPKQPAVDFARLNSLAGVDSALMGRLKRYLVGAGSLEETRAVVETAIQKNQKLLSVEQNIECNRLIDELSKKVLAGPDLGGRERFQLLVALNGLKSWQGFVYKWPLSNELGATERDKGMARNVLNYKQFVMRPGERAVLWAHNFHLSYDSPKIEINDDEIKGSVMGRSLRENLGDFYRAIGLIGFRVGAALPKAKAKNYQAGAGSLEHALNILDKDLFINTRAAGRRLDGKVLMSEIFSGDYVGQEYDTESRLNPREQFLGLVFLRESKSIERD